MQKITSAKTSRNQIPALFKKVEFKKGSTNFDFGCGKFLRATNYLESINVKNLRYDPFNVSKEINEESINSDFDTLTLCNVLNVVNFPTMKKILSQVCLLVCRQPVYISIYEGDKTGIGKKTKDGFQANAKKYIYESLLKGYFKNVDKKEYGFKCYGIK